MIEQPLFSKYSMHAETACCRPNERQEMLQWVKAIDGQSAEKSGEAQKAKAGLKSQKRPR
jgi:hypothetical protein